MTGSRLRTGELFWSVSGSALSHPLVMLHSLGADSTMWEPNLGGLSTIRRLISIDLPGHGASSAAPGPYSLDEIAQDVIDAAGAAGAVRFDVCGISLGGLIGLWLAINAPDRVTGLVAANTAARVGTEALWQERIDAVTAGGMESIRDRVVARFFTTQFARRDPEWFARVNGLFAAVDPVGYSGCCAALRDADLRQSVAGIRCPTLIVAGDQDVATPVSESEWLQGQIAGSHLEVIEEAAHLSSLEQPDIFTSVVHRFLAALQPV
ncbi:MAG: 3-oxoadipate enol-lactonase [Acidimicrobiia bacterium]